jgi:riboflavin synthase
LFTGIVETKASIVEVRREGAGRRFLVSASNFALGPKLGDSIAISGCCLTVVGFSGGILEFEAGEETLSKTTLGILVAGSQVNIERALSVGDRLGGHYVTGHVDATISLLERRDDPPWSHLRFELPNHLAGQVASKGSVTLDGVSLTVVDAESDSFTVALIPHTLDVTTLGELSVGDRVNFETDVLAKYVQRSLLFAATKPAVNPIQQGS